MKHSLLLLCLTAIGTLLFSQGPPQKMDPVIQYANTITPGELKAHLEFLASDELEGRETSERGQKLAAKYLATQFEEIGLKPIVEVDGKKSWYQTYQLVKTTIDQPEVSIDGKGKKRYGLREDFFCYGASSMSKDLNMEMVFAGHGIQDEKYDNLKGLDLEGKAAVVLSGEPMDPGGNSMITGKPLLSAWTMNWRKKREALKAAGAIGMIVIYEQKSFEDNAHSKWLKHSLERPSYQLKYQADSKEHFPVIYISEKLGDELLKNGKLSAGEARTQLIRKAKVPKVDFKEQTFQMHASIKQEIVTGENVLGLLEGTDKKEEVVVMTAHYDHLGVGENGVVYNGADDDGTGTVALIEMAEAFMEAAKNGHRPRRSILFMPVSGEEKGLLGSRYYTDHPVWPLEKTVTDLNIDMIGRIDGEEDDWKKAGDSNYVYVIGSNMLSSELDEASKQAGAKYVPELVLDYNYNDPDDPNRFYYRSDHYNFAKKGIPVIFYFTGVHEDYHKPTDTIEKVMFGKTAIITRLVFATAWEVANRDEKLKVDRENGFKKER